MSITLKTETESASFKWFKQESKIVGASSHVLVIDAYGEGYTTTINEEDARALARFLDYALERKASHE